MKQLNRWQTALFITGAVLMVIGAGTSLLRWDAAPWLFAAGALAYTTMQMQQTYEGRNFTVRRLRRIMAFSDFLLLLTAVLMFISRWPQLGGLDWLTYVNYVHNNWVVTLLIAAILQLYTTYRIDNELAHS
ncbi:MAG: hypothetical protein IJ887_10445 [Prevotella sp.]|nr:hypothetical protein [Prevotella sp.]MBR3411276.1 hypothetical protein [Bacteroidales bacterium]MBR3479962.1 hypothetical protein [Prevotella sp.]MBR6189006.1 hypothetical protein [Prevotella sp.]